MVEKEWGEDGFINKIIYMLKQQEQEWFDKLTQKRRNTVRVLEEEGLISLFVSHIVDTYRDTAHFIYELLQNADDAKATYVRIRLSGSCLLFSHNGTQAFSISNPDIERKGDVPGHINSITTFSLSNKPVREKEDIENKIGKFGIGFKSVFQYTDSPEIYNPPFCFRITNFMVPEQIDSKPHLIEEGTTAFLLPFDKLDFDSSLAFKEISEKLLGLDTPLLFLRNIVKIEIDIEGNKKFIVKKESAICLLYTSPSPRD